MKKTTLTIRSKLIDGGMWDRLQRFEPADRVNDGVGLIRQNGRAGIELEINMAW
jgi:hypothetical protein